MQKTLSTLAPIILLAVTLSGCAPAPLGRNYWNQAHRQFEQGDYADTLAYLNDILSRDTDYDNRASGWKVVILDKLEGLGACW